MQAIWDAATTSLRDTLSPQVFEMWIRPLRPLGLDDGVLEVGVPNAFFGDLVQERFQRPLEEAVLAAAGQPLGLRFVVVAEAPEPPAAPPPPPVAVAARTDTVLNPAYTFDSFVVGAGNQFAHAACLAVGHGQGRTYNPLFLYGGVGLGKTHLINAIGHAFLARRPSARIAYISAERFTNELINALQMNRMADFNNRYRNSCDVLLVDDIQFIAGKERTQEAFFHTFNTLHASGKQIVMTSDKSPKDIANLEERLRTRFEWGLIADVQPPDMETKVAILRRKASGQGIELPDDVALFIAAGAATNIRELEGLLTRLGAQAELTGRPITMESARDALRDLMPRRQREITIEDVCRAVATYYDVRVSDLKSDRKLQAYVVPRQLAMYLSRKMVNASFPQIGERFGGKDHSTVIHAVKRVETRLAADPDFSRTVDSIRATIEAA
jgi:chromosomal replication initiator protein